MKIIRTRSWSCYRSAFLISFGLMLTAPMPATLASPTQEPRQAAIDLAVSQVRPALVRIHVVTTDHRQGREVKYEGAGSGTIITKEGHVITNHHVAGKACRLVCTLLTKEEVEADLVGTDPLSDIAVIKLRSPAGRAFPVAHFGDSRGLKVGDPVLAMGSPLALSQSVTLGIISNTEMIFPKLFWPFNKLTLEGEDVGSIVRWIGHDAAIFGGNSGGPLVNLRGEIVGINEISLGLSGAIPSNLAKTVADSLIKAGKVSRSWIGLEVQPLLKSYGIRQGVLVSGAIQGSPAAEAGFAPGDLLVRLDGQTVDVRFAEELPLFNQRLMSLPIGKEVNATIWRQGQEHSLRIIPRERESVQSKTEELKAWGISASNLTLWMVKEMRRLNKNGVLVKSIRPGGPCQEAKPAILENDIIVEVARQPVSNVEELAVITERLTKDKQAPVPVIVAFERKMERFLTVVSVGTRIPYDAGLEASKAWLPVGLQVLTRDLAEALGWPGRSGVRVTQVYPNSTAERAKLQVDDLITAVNDQPIAASQPEDIEVLPTMIRQYKIGAAVELTVLRAEQPLKIKAVLAASPKLPREMKKYWDENFEFTVREATFSDDVEDPAKEDNAGLFVDNVSEGGWAALGHLAVGDRILTVDRLPIRDVAALEKVMKKIAEIKSKSVVFQVRRGIHSAFIELEPAWTRAR
ncbi:MAG: PDZ domain-containing protein [Acidobacteria bacterium]|nr:PDZ domain-containing protein [Acidobacteriota bacterium]MBI3656684.1 PDZ domain-containing protein [Acidobacteriota bacterium]